MSQARRERRKNDRELRKGYQRLDKLVRQQNELEGQFAETFRESGLDPYGTHSEQFQMALKTHGVK